MDAQRLAVQPDWRKRFPGRPGDELLAELPRSIPLNSLTLHEARALPGEGQQGSPFHSPDVVSLPICELFFPQLFWGHSFFSFSFSNAKDDPPSNVIKMRVVKAYAPSSWRTLTFRMAPEKNLTVNTPGFFTLCLPSSFQEPRFKPNP